jgi:hypothetical protein
MSAQAGAARRRDRYAGLQGERLEGVSMSRLGVPCCMILDKA